MADSKGKAKGADLQGLDNFSASTLLGEKADKGVNYAPLNRFHEDEDNARRSFDLIKLQELADSMEQINPATGQLRGILEPLQVSPHPEIEGDFVINGGNRRYRAALMAGLEEAPYIIKDSLDSFDKFILNDQREDLSPLEIASFIKTRLEEKYKANEIAKALGRHPSYVSDHSIFFNMSDHIRALYDEGLCRSMQALALLHRAHKKEPGKVEAFCLKVSELQEEVTTSQTRNFVNTLKKTTPKKVYRNAHTGEVIEVRNRNDKTLKSWYEEYGKDVVERWLETDSEPGGDNEPG
ncbi:ParB/RepB/Spo0J family partition protein, partial [Halomonas sp. 3D7M]|uniref:ParB/RepB/Spo0J family partition protein n=1 Tax=Halomonas sp. 3D7M TaxID=2742617 RepID=UPI00186839EF